MLHGDHGAYRLHGDIADAGVPATLQATIGARIDRLASPAKQTLNASAVIGSQFDTELLSGLTSTVDVDSLIAAQLVEQVRFTPRPEYGFRHPLIRTVAYESQLKSDRAQLHRLVAEAIQARGSADENAALIAEHVEAADDLHGAFAWHMRAGAWLTNRDIDAAQTSWQRARQVADRLPDDDPDPRTDADRAENSIVRNRVAGGRHEQRSRIQRAERIVLGHWRPTVARHRHDGPCDCQEHERALSRGGRPRHRADTTAR